MVLLSLHGLSPAQIAVLVEYDPGHGAPLDRPLQRLCGEGLVDRSRSGRPRLGGRRLPARITGLLERPGLWTVPCLHRYLRRPHISRHTLYRRVRQAAVWRRPKLVARGEPARTAVAAALVKRLRLLPPATAVWTADETHVHLLPNLHSNWTTPAQQPQIVTPGRHRQLTVLGALEVTTGTFRYRLGRRCAADFLALLQQLGTVFPAAPAVVVLCDNDSIHHARRVREFVAARPGLHLWYEARYSPHDNFTERVWAALKAFLANTATTWPGRRRQVHAFFRALTQPAPDHRSPLDQPLVSNQLPTELLERRLVSGQHGSSP
ncbi:IS630 family transposase [Streptomyces sp. NPDC026294]|uniref:IS630 family transposase n=1 Tax=Streptomyces sp. NPDC026294 TaxID=3155362 RepID=UPI0033DC71CC